MKFNNSCNCIYDEEVLTDAIKLECERRNYQLKEEYKIYLHNGYPSISIGHDKVRIHVIIGKLLYKFVEKGFVIHHKDHNKLNALPNNLEYISNKAHTKLHMSGNDFRTEKGKWNGINSAKEKRYKNEIKKEEIEEMLSQGKTKYEIARYFNCGVNTIYRRLGYKF